MRAMNILNQTLCPKLETIHKIRTKAVFSTVDSLLRGGRLSLTALGRSCPKGTTHKHSIKRVDRLLGNKHLHKELPIFYRAIAHTFLKNCLRPIILIDWTRIEPDHIALVASVPLDGRSLPIYLEVHPQKKDNNPTVMKNFLNQLRWVLPENSVPIIVTDAGFRNGWFKAVEKMKWDFLGRLRNTPYMCRVGDEKWKRLKKLHRFAQSKPHNLGVWTISQSNSINARIIAYRKRKSSKKSKPAPSSVNLKNQSKNKEPWILATSLTEHSAKQITNIYSKRMQIEETFRDAKNHRFGWSFRHARSNDKNRFATLLLIGTIAMLAATLLGNAAEQKKIHHRYQANTIRTRRVLSLFFLGITLIKNEEDTLLTLYDLQQSYQYLRQLPGQIDD